MFSRRGHERTARLPGLVDEVAGIHCRSAIIDAELCLPGSRRRLERLVEWSDMPCLRLVEAFAGGEQLLEVAQQHRLEGIVSKRCTSPYRSSPSRDWRKIKTAARREANRERWRLFEAAR